MPKKFDEFIGNPEIVDFVKQWAEKWSKGEKQKPLVLYGIPGVGKTILAYIIAEEMGWELFETNASDLRNKENIEKVTGAASNNSSLFGSKRLILLDEIDSLQSQDRGGAGAIMSIIKNSNNPVILTANNIYSDRKLVPLRSIAELKEFKKINYLSIAKYLRGVCDNEGIEYEDEAVKELAKNSGGDLRSALLDLESLSPKITKELVESLSPRERKEKIFPVITKIFKGHDLREINKKVFSSKVSSELLIRWVEENIPRQFDGIDSANAFNLLSRGDIFNGRIFRRQHFSFLKYSNFLSTVGVGLSRRKDYSGWKPFQFPSLLSSLSRSTAKRKLRKGTSLKIGKKTHESSSQVMQELPFIELIFKKNPAYLTHFFDFDEENVAFLLGTKKDTKKVKKVVEESSQIKKEKILRPKNQKTLFN